MEEQTAFTGKNHIPESRRPHNADRTADPESQILIISYNVSLTLDDGTITVSGKAKGAYTPSITGRMPKGGELELAYTFLPLAGEEDLDEIVDGIKKAKLTTEWLKKNISDLIAEEKQTPHGN